MSYVWIFTLSANHELLDVGKLLVSSKRCLVLDRKRAEAAVKVRWVPFQVANDTIRTALKSFGKVEVILREKWNVGSFVGVE